jgi:hypothetical protein
MHNRDVVFVFMFHLRNYGIDFDVTFNGLHQKLSGIVNFCSFITTFRRAWDPPSFLSSGYQGLSLGIKRSGREADHSPPCGVPLSYSQCLNVVYLCTMCINKSDTVC